MYCSKLNLVDTEKAIKHIKEIFESELSANLNLLRVSAPLFLETSTGLNDNLTGVEQPVSFDVNQNTLEVVQSLAKWKRMALYRYELQSQQGLYAEMNGIRPSVKIDELHSIYVDQWDWEKVVSKEDRNIEKLKEIVNNIYKALKKTEITLNQQYPKLREKLPTEITFIDSQDLELMFPSLTPKEREYEIVKHHKAVFLIGIGKILKSGNVHDYRAPDYDDWDLNGDILLYHEPLDKVLGLLSMGIRVNSEVLEKQLALTNTLHRKELDFHKLVLNDVLPLSVGGGIGQSRLCMFLLEKAHIGEVQVSVWPKEVVKECAYKRIFLL